MLKTEQRHLLGLVKEHLKKGEMTFGFAGSSMLPILRERFQVTVKEATCLKPGDILAFSENDTLVCHRLMLMFNNKYCMKGDNRLSPDFLVSHHNVIGKISEAYDTNGDLISESSLRLRWLWLHQLYCRTYLFIGKNLPRNPAARSFLRSINTLIAKFLRRMSLKRQDSSNQPKK